MQFSQTLPSHSPHLLQQPDRRTHSGGAVAYAPMVMPNGGYVLVGNGPQLAYLPPQMMSQPFPSIPPPAFQSSAHAMMNSPLAGGVQAVAVSGAPQFALNPYSSGPPQPLYGVRSSQQSPTQSPSLTSLPSAMASVSMTVLPAIPSPPPSHALVSAPPYFAHPQQAHFQQPPPHLLVQQPQHPLQQAGVHPVMGFLHPPSCASVC